MLWRNSTKQSILFFLSLCLFALSLAGHAATDLNADKPVTLAPHLRLFHADSEHAPADAAALSGWLATLRPAEKISLFGGSYWLYGRVSNPTANSAWVLDPDGRLIDRVDVYIYPASGNTQHFTTGYRAEHNYMLHYGKNFQLAPGQSAQILIRIESPYFAATPAVRLQTEAGYRAHILLENVLALGAFGALLTLALYNLFIYTIHHDKEHYYYALYLVAYFAGWMLTFQVPAELFGWHDLHWHYVPFFLLPVLNTLFYTRFLQLPTLFPRLHQLSKVNLILPLALLPSCFIALPYAHMLATVSISIWLFIALTCGIVSLRNGFRPARYFVLAFLALLLPGLIILPANVGLMASAVPNAELFTLLGGTLDAILLALALADKIRRFAQERDHALQHLFSMVKLARTDHLTGIHNRHAFDLDLFNRLNLPDGSTNTNLTLFLIDLDGLKQVNDIHGHARGDELLCLFTRELTTLTTEDVLIYRIGGDEFTILADAHEANRLNSGLKRIEKILWDAGFPETGISFGTANATEGVSVTELYTRADQMMYEHKLSHRASRQQTYSPAPRQA